MDTVEIQDQIPVQETSSVALESKAFTLMGSMFGAEALSSVKDLVAESNNIAINVTLSELQEVGNVAGIGAMAGAVVDTILTTYVNKLEERVTGQKPVPAMGRGCSLIPGSAAFGAAVGVAVKLITMANGGN
ncbi:TPA: hypothetical protein DCZ77_01365 [Patescibacteria group bacterium]|nr:hypothetical protein [Patescibacteria group bacterium]